MLRALALVAFGLLVAGLVLLWDAPEASAQIDIPKDGLLRKCYCSNGGHAWVSFQDGISGKKYNRGFYAEGYGSSNGEARPVPNGGDPGPAPYPSDYVDRGLTSQFGGNVITGVRGFVKDEGNKSGDCICLLVTKELFDRAARAVDAWPRTYRLQSQNCVDFVEYIAEAEGTTMVDTATWYGLSHPAIMAKNIRERNGLPPGATVTQDSSGQDSGESSGESSGSISQSLDPSQEAPGTAVAMTEGPERFLDDPVALGRELARTHPVAAADMGTAQAVAGQPLALQAGVNYNPPRTQVATNSLVAWEGGDGTVLVTRDPVLRYDKPGDYTARLTVIEGRPGQLWWQGLLKVHVAPSGTPLGGAFASPPAAVAAGNYLQVKPLGGTASNPLVIQLRDGNNQVLDEESIVQRSELKVRLPPGAYTVGIATRLLVVGAETGPVTVGKMSFQVQNATEFDLGLSAAETVAVAARTGVGAAVSLGVGAGLTYAAPPAIARFAPHVLTSFPRAGLAIGLAGGVLSFAPLVPGILGLR
jgi:hypothetical protein